MSLETSSTEEWGINWQLHRDWLSHGGTVDVSSGRQWWQLFGWPCAVFSQASMTGPQQCQRPAEGAGGCTHVTCPSGFHLEKPRFSQAGMVTSAQLCGTLNGSFDIFQNWTQLREQSVRAPRETDVNTGLHSSPCWKDAQEAIISSEMSKNCETEMGTEFCSPCGDWYTVAAKVQWIRLTFPHQKGH